MTRRRSRFVAIGILAAAVAGCTDSEDAGDTLAPLPVSGATAAPSVSVAASTVPPASSSPAITESAALVADWDGAEFDVGVIDRIGELGGYRTIDFDRYSYRDPERGLIDASAFVEEPIAYAWIRTPFVNIQEQLRTFVLAEDVEVLVLSGDAAQRSCRDRRPAPRPVWISVGVAYLDQPAATEDVASLTYSDDGQVTRIRFTHGCQD